MHPQARALRSRALSAFLFGVGAIAHVSVWIRFLSNRAPYAAELEDLLTSMRSCGHDFVFGELLIADVGGRRQLLADYEQMHEALMPHRDVVVFVRDRR